MKTRLIHVRDSHLIPRRDYVYIGRPSMWGNPHPVGRPCPKCHVRHTRIEAVATFHREFMEDKNLQRAVVKHLKGKVLGCWCYPAPCHGNVYVDLCNAIDP